MDLKSGEPGNLFTLNSSCNRSAGGTVRNCTFSNDGRFKEEVYIF